MEWILITVQKSVMGCSVNLFLFPLEISNQLDINYDNLMLNNHVLQKSVLFSHRKMFFTKKYKAQMETLLKWLCHLDFLARKAAPGYNPCFKTATPNSTAAPTTVFPQSGNKLPSLRSSHCLAERPICFQIKSSKNLLSILTST